MSVIAKNSAMIRLGKSSRGADLLDGCKLVFDDQDVLHSLISVQEWISTIVASQS